LIRNDRSGLVIAWCRGELAGDALMRLMMFKNLLVLSVLFVITAI
jgi:hypothetical protein